jgi:AcrR family transcriptional regulator
LASTGAVEPRYGTEVDTPKDFEVEPAQAVPPAIDKKVLEAATRVLSEQGWEGLNLDKVAEAAGMSRVTVWRQGVTKEALVSALLAELALDFQATMWPVVMTPGSGRERLEAGLNALCDVADRHLSLLLASDHVFHRGFRQAHSGPKVDFVAPFRVFVSEGRADGSLPQHSDDPLDTAELLFNTACWGYVHLRGRHGWSTERARGQMVPLVVRGMSH